MATNGGAPRGSPRYSPAPRRSAGAESPSLGISRTRCTNPISDAPTRSTCGVCHCAASSAVS
jgi:hypothetical protein